MSVTGVDLLTIEAALVSPCRTSFGSESGREARLVGVVSDEAEGCGECGAGSSPQYSSQYT
ncbi:o-succinylbenzoate synthase, partial [Streptomyces sp. JV190]|nr:o-succinylbenzoate synthase [Streptomyces sp. JV190]